MTVLVTGHRGIVGTAVQEALGRAGCETRGFDLRDGDDVRDAATLDPAVAGCDVIVHLAAEGRYTASSRLIMQVNVVGTWNVLAAAARHGVEKVVFMSSISALGLRPGLAHPHAMPIGDDHPPEPHDPYEWSKLIGERLCERLSSTHGIPTICLRPPQVLSSEDLARDRHRRRQEPAGEWVYGWWFGAFIHADDLAEAVVAALGTDVEGHHTVLVNGPDVASAVPTGELCAGLLPDAPIARDGATSDDLYWPTVDDRRARRLVGWEPVRAWGREELDSLAARAALRRTSSPLVRRRPLAPAGWVAPCAVRLGEEWTGWLSGIHRHGEDRRLQVWTRVTGIDRSHNRPWSRVPRLWDELAHGDGELPYATVIEPSGRAGRMADLTGSFDATDRRIEGLQRVGRRVRREPRVATTAKRLQYARDEARWRVRKHRSGFEMPAAATLADWARVLETDLRQRVLPYWHDTTVDHARGGYLVGDHAWRRTPPVAKQVICQSRMLWTFALAHRLGLSDERHDYLEAATSGYRFLQQHFLDRSRGGYWWMTLLDGTPSHRGKLLSAQALVLYGLVEYHRASGDREPLEQAEALWARVHRHLHDGEHGGWSEHAQADWTLSRAVDPLTLNVAGLKSGDCHLHVMEALTELTAATGTDEATSALAEAVDVNRSWFFPDDPSQVTTYCSPSGEPVVVVGNEERVSLGHSVEFAWLLQRAQVVLGRDPEVDLLERYVRFAFAKGWDEDYGGLLDWVSPSGTLAVEKTWWDQAEMLSALATLGPGRLDAQLEEATQELLRYVWRRHRDPRDGIWLATIGRRDRVVEGSKATEWKDAYHDVRAMVLFVQAFGDGWGAAAL